MRTQDATLGAMASNLFIAQTLLAVAAHLAAQTLIADQRSAEIAASLIIGVLAHAGLLDTIADRDVKQIVGQIGARKIEHV
jgi:hypothetical protein